MTVAASAHSKRSRCIFCGQDSSASTSVEHIIPESLGNTDHILPRGVVCDPCNNYFARKVEGPLLSSVHFKNLRARQLVPNKGGAVPPMIGVYPAAGIGVQLLQSESDGLSVAPLLERENRHFVETMQRRPSGRLLFAIESLVDQRLLARFLGKVGLEVIAQRALEAGLGLQEIVDHRQLDLLRGFVRRGSGPSDWPVHQRRIYDEEETFKEPNGYSFQVLHEFQMFYVSSELYVVVCIFGTEFAMNMGGPSVESYKAWLASNEGRSPLY